MPTGGRLVSAALLMCSLGLAALAARQSSEPPYTPADSMRTFQLEPGFRIQVAASEPDIQSPVAMDIDEQGRWFVVEMPGYPLDVAPTGKVKLLEDTDGDGRPDRTSVFADNLVLPHGVMRWKRGILVAAAPDIIYFEDTDGDRRADVRRVVLTGFAFSNPQHTVNSPLYGLDNWIYLAHQGAAGATFYKELFGDRGKPLRFPERPDVAPVPPRDRTVRFRPDAWQVEPIAGESQFGHTFDAYGRYFGNDNSHHLWHEVIAARYLQRNPHLPVRAVMRDIPEHGAAARVFPITRRPNFELLTEAGEFTSASAPTAYLGGAWPGAFEGSMKFYGEILGLKEIWRGSAAGSKTLSWVNLRVPDGEDYVEFMLYEKYPMPVQLRTLHHICLEVPNVEAAAAVLAARKYPEGNRAPTPMRAGVNGKRQINYFDGDGTRVEIMEPAAHDGKPRPPSALLPPVAQPKPVATTGGPGETR